MLKNQKKFLFTAGGLPVFKFFYGNMLRNQKGLSLTEVLVTVSIIGILGAISVPSYRNMRANARVTEAKTSMGQLYVAEKSFFLQWGCYITDLKTIGFKPDGELIYNVGFKDETDAANFCDNYHGPTVTGTNNDLLEICGQDIGSGTKLQNCGFRFKNQGITPPDIPTDSSSCIETSKAVKFRAVAIANVKDPASTNTGKTGANMWTIDNYKRVVQVQDIDGNTPSGVTNPPASFCTGGGG